MPITLKLPLAIAVVVLVTSLVLVQFASYSVRSQAAAEAVQIREEKTAQVKQDLADKVNTVWALIDAQYREATDEQYLEARYGGQLRAILDVAGATLRAQAERVRRGELPLARAQQEAAEALRGTRFAGGKGYLWVNDVGRPVPKMVMHPVLPELEGRVLDSKDFETVGEPGRNLFQVAVELALSKGEGFLRYRWPEPVGAELMPRMPKISYVRLVPEWGWVVGTGLYIDEAVAEKLGETTSDIRKIRYGAEYFWINDVGRPVPKMVMHPMRPELDGQVLDRPEFQLAVDGREQNLFAAFRDLTEATGEGYAQYQWPRLGTDGKPGPVAAKLSYVKRYAPLGWVIGTGRHVDDIEAAIAQKTAAAEAQVSALIRRITVASLLIVLGAVLAGVLLASTLTRPITQLVRLTRAIAEDDQHLSRRVGLRTRDEIGELAREFDVMAEKVDRSLRRVREQRELLQSVLSSMPHAIYWTDAHGVFQGCNEGFARAFGLPRPEAIVGKTAEALGLTPEQREQLRSRGAEVMAAGRAGTDQREVLRGADGRDRQYLASRVPLRDQGGNLMGLLAVLVALPEQA